MQIKTLFLAAFLFSSSAFAQQVAPPIPPPAPSAGGGGAPSGPAGGDLTGTYPNPTINSIQGTSITGTTGTVKNVLSNSPTLTGLPIINNGTITLPAFPTGTNFVTTGSTGFASRNLALGQGIGGMFTGARIPAGSTALPANTEISSFNAGGWDGSSLATGTGALVITTGANPWTTTAHSAGFSFNTVPEGTTVLQTNVVTLAPSGLLTANNGLNSIGSTGIGTSAPGYKLDVWGGDIAFPYGNCIRANNSIPIANSKVLCVSFVGGNDQVAFYAPGNGANDGNVMMNYANGAVAIGTSGNGTNALNVYGGATIGQGYLSTGAPANGLSVQGFIGIGTTTVPSALTVGSGAPFQVTTAGAVTGTAFTGGTGSFTTLAASSTVSGSGFSAYLASPPAIGATTASTGAFTNLSISGALSGAGVTNYLSSPSAIGNTVANSGAFTTLSASSTVSGTGFTNYFAAPPTLGNTTPNTGKFTTLVTTGSTAIGTTGLTSLFNTGSLGQFQINNSGQILSSLGGTSPGFNIDISNSSYSLATGANLAITQAGSGAMVVTNVNNGDTALFIFGAGTVLLEGSTSSTWISGALGTSCSPASGKVCFYYNSTAGQYYIYSNYGSTITVYPFLLRTKPTS